MLLGEAPGEPAVVTNLSRSGACVLARTALHPWTRVRARIELRDSPTRGTTLDIEGAVIWCRPSGARRAGTFELGISFLGLSAEDTETLSRFVARSLARKRRRRPAAVRT